MPDESDHSADEPAPKGDALPADEASVAEGLRGAERRHRRRQALAVALAVVAVLGAAAGALVLGRGSAPERSPSRLTPAERTDGTGTPGGSDGASASAGETRAPSPTPSEPATGAGSGAGSGAGAYVPGWVAYRSAGAIWVARVLDDERITDIREVAPDGSDRYAVSPDGRTLAAVDVSGTLALYDVRTGVPIVVGAAFGRPAWSPDSRWLAYARPGDSRTRSIVRIARDGGSEQTVGQGQDPVVGPDGALAWVAQPESGKQGRGTVFFLEGASVRSVPTTGRPSSIALGAGEFYYSTLDEGWAGAGAARTRLKAGIWAMRRDGTGRRRLVEEPLEPEPYGYGALSLSPDGSRLAFAELGDDLYSRVSVIRTDGAGRIALSSRRDTYVATWGPDGDCLLLFEGNTLQGEPSRLLCTLLDGTERRTLVQDAAR